MLLQPRETNDAVARQEVDATCRSLHREGAAYTRIHHPIRCGLHACVETN